MRFTRKIMEEKKESLASGDKAIFPIASVAKMLNLHPRTLMKYEKFGLLKPTRDPKNGRRFYSNNDVKWITCIMKLVHEEGFNLRTLNYVLSLSPCWIVRQCPDEMRRQCPAYLGRSKPCWEVVNIVCKPKSKHPSCKRCVFFMTSIRKKEMMIRNFGTLQ